MAAIYLTQEEIQTLLIQPVSPYLKLLSKDRMVLAQPFKVHKYRVNFRGKLRCNKVNESQSCALTTGWSFFISLCMFFTSSFPNPLCSIHIYIYIFICVHIPNSGVPLLLPPLLSDSLVVQLPLYSLPSPEAGVLRGFVPASPAVLATYSSWWGCSRSLHGWEKAMKGGRRRRKC